MSTALATDVNGQVTQWFGAQPFQAISVLVSAGAHTFRWSFEKGQTPGGTGQAYLDDVSFPTPSVGVQDLYDDQTLYRKNDAQVFPGSPLLSVLHIGSSSLPSGMQQVGDPNLHRVQGHIQIEQNAIDSSANAGILVDAGTRDANTNNPYSSVRNL